MDAQTLKSQARRLKVGDVLEITLLEDVLGENFEPGVSFEIPIACKLITKDAIELFFYHHEFRLNVEPDREEPGFISEVVLDCLAFTNIGPVLRLKVDGGATDHRVSWKKIASAH